MDKDRMAGCIKLISLDIVRLLIIIIMIFILGVRFTILSTDDFSTNESDGIVYEETSDVAMANIP